jgi:2-dehydropantoate 2-reductase
MRILVVGAGATGGWYGARLARAGRDVTFLVRPERAAVLRERGLRLTGVDDEMISPRTVTADELDGPYDVVLLAVKALGLEQALDDVAPAVGPNTVIVPFLNGMSHMDALGKRFGDRVLGGVIRIATTVGPEGEIVRFAPFASMAVGELDGSVSPRVKELVAQLDGAGFDVALSSAIVATLWHKWVFIAATGAFNCLGRGSVGEIVAQPGGPELGPALLAEAGAVCAAAGYPAPESEIAAGTRLLTQEGSPFASSMYRDVLAGRATEVEPILGDFVARAAELGVAVPMLDLATLQLRVHQRRVLGDGA